MHLDSFNTMKKITVSIDENLFLKADLLARELGVSQSQLYARAIESFVKEQEDIELLADINAAYPVPDTPAEHSKRAMMKDYRKRLARGKW